MPRRAVCRVLTYHHARRSGCAVGFSATVKLFKTFKAASVFRELRILIRTLVESMMSLVWSVILLFFIMLSGGIFLAQVTAGVLDLECWD